MCYNVAQMEYRKYKYAMRYGDLSDEEKDLLTESWKQFEEENPELFDVARFHSNGFSYPPLFTLIDDNGLKATRFIWGLVPHWVKDDEQADQIRRNTLNARGESIFEKPSFRSSAKDKRCLIVVDGFYEHHHLKGKKYPYFVQHEEKDRPLVFGGLWSEWVNKSTGEIRQTASIVTTKANGLMSTIHNNPKAKSGPRMPLILDEENFEIWLKSKDKDEIRTVIKPYDERLKAHTVSPLTGKKAVENTEAKIKEQVYPELLPDGGQNKLF